MFFVSLRIFTEEVGPIRGVALFWSLYRRIYRLAEASDRAPGNPRRREVES